MDIKLREIASSKAAGVYFIVTDNSAVDTIAEISKMRLMFISSEKGPVNTVVVFNSGDKTSFQSVFGASTRQMEKRGNYSLKAAVEALEGGPLAVMNLRSFNDQLDRLGIRGFGASTKKGESGDAPYRSIFNTNTLWTVTPKLIPNQLTQTHLLNIADVGTSDISVFFVVSTDAHVAELTDEGDMTIRNSQLVIDEYSGLDPEKLIKDTFVDVYIFNNTFDPATVGTNKYYGQYFDSKGNLDLSKLDALTEIPEAGFNRRITGSLIPNLKSKQDVDLSLDTIINQSYAETGLVCFINDDVLETDDTNVIDFDGSSFYDEDGNFIEGSSPLMLSHVVPQKIERTMVKYPPLADELHEISNQEVVFETEKISDTEFIAAFEQGIRVGDKIKGLDGNVVEVTGIEIIEENVPAVDPTEPTQKYMVSINTPTNGMLSVMNGDVQISNGQQVDENTVLELFATPAKDYKFSHYVINGQQLQPGVNQIVIAGDTTIEAVFRKVQYTVSFDQPTNGSIIVNDAHGEIVSGDSVDKGTEITINVTPNNGYQLGTITVNGVELDPGVNSGIVNKDTVIAVEMIPVRYKVSYTVPTDGVITLTDGDGNAVANNSMQPYGAIINVNVIPNPYFTLDKIYVNSTALEENVTSFMLEKATTINVTFDRKQGVLTLSPTVNGTFIVKDRLNNQITTGSKVDLGTVLSIELMPSENYEVKQVLVNNSQLAGTTFTMFGNTTLSVEFGIIKRKITKLSAENGDYTVTDDGGQVIVSGRTVNQGSTISIEAFPAEHYELKQILVNNSPLPEDQVNGNIGTFTVGKLDVVIAVEFQEIMRTVTIQSESDKVTTELRVNGETVTGDKIADGSLVTIITTPVAGQVVSSIKVNGAPIDNNMFVINSDTTIVIETKLKTFTVSYNTNIQNGTIDVLRKDPETLLETPINNGSKLEYGSMIVVKPTAAQYYKLLNILVNNEIKEIGDDDNLEFQLDNDVMINALFIMQTYTLSLQSQPANGQVKVYDGNNVQVDLPATVNAFPPYKIVAIPNEHYRVKTLTLNGTNIESGEDVSFTTNSVIVASFEEIKWVVNQETPTNGSFIVSANSLQVNKGGTVTDGTSIVITPTANQYFELDQIIVNDGTADHVLPEGVFNYTVMSDVTVRVTFKHKIAVFNLDKTGFNAGNVSVKVSENGTDWTPYNGMSTYQNNKVAVVWNETEDFAINFNVTGVAVETAPASALGDGETGKMFTILTDTNATIVSKRLFTVTSNPTTNGSFKLLKDGEEVSGKVQEGDVITIETTPDANYELDTMEVNNNPITSPFTVPAWTDHSITSYAFTVTFKQIMRRVTIGKVSDSNGNSITVKNGSVSMTGVNSVAQGTVLTIEKTLADGWQVDSVLVNGTKQGDITEFIVPESDSTIIATFKRVQYRIDYSSPVTGGTFTVTRKTDGGTVNNGDMVDSGTTLQVNVTPNTNYKVSTITVNGSPIDNNEFIPTENSTVVVNFEIEQATVTFSPATIEIASKTYNVKMYEGTGNDVTTEIASGNKVDFGKSLKVEIKADDSTEIAPEDVVITLTKDSSSDVYVYGTSFIPVNASTINVTVAAK